MYRKNKNISELKEGEIIEDIFVVKIKKRIFQYMDNSKYGFELILSDSSGSTVSYKFWGDADQNIISRMFDSVKEDDVVLVKGKVQRFKDKLQISSNSPEDFRILEKGQYLVEDFIRPPKHNTEEMFNKLISNINNVKNEELKTFLLSIFEDPEFSEKYKKHPAAIEIHHNRMGGLLEHVLEIIEILKTCKKLYPELDEDLLIAGAILHDIGKIDEIEMTSRIKGTAKGQLISHIVLGSAFILNKMEKFKINEELKHKVLHLIVSHQGRLEFGSPKEPMFPEAFALYYADELSSKLSEILEFVENSKRNTEDAFMYNRRHGRNIFLK